MIRRASLVLLTTFACALPGCFDAFPAGALVDGAPPDGAITDLATDIRDAEVRLDFDLPPPRDMTPDRGRPSADARPPRLDMHPPLADRGLPPLDMGPSPPDMAPPPPDMAPPPPDMAPPPMDMAPPLEPEVCNGLDDDRNGIVDDAPVCGRVISTRCRVFLGWGDNRGGPDGPSPTWGDCPGDDADGWDLDSTACVGTRRDGAFRELGMPAFADVNDDDSMGVAFICDGGPPEVIEYVGRACRVWFGQADNDAAAGAAEWDVWGPCPGRERGVDGAFNCVSSAGDGRFHPMPLIGAVDDNDAFAVAFTCRDGADPQRAEAMQASVAVFLGYSERLATRPGDGERWGDCPGPDARALDNAGSVRCASSSFDGRFHRFETLDNVDWRASFGVALVPHPDAPAP